MQPVRVFGVHYKILLILFRFWWAYNYFSFLFLFFCSKALFSLWMTIPNSLNDNRENLLKISWCAIFKNFDFQIYVDKAHFLICKLDYFIVYLIFLRVNYFHVFNLNILLEMLLFLLWVCLPSIERSKGKVPWWW